MNKDTTKQSDQNPPEMSSQTAANTSNVNSDKGVYDPKTGTWVTSSSQLETAQNLKDRQRYNQTINKALAAKGIKLSPNEKLTLTVDKDGQVTVTGINDDQKKGKIEEVLNSAKQDLGSGLLLHIESVKAMNGEQNPLDLDKWLIQEYLKNQVQQDLSDLKLVNGSIIGANEKLQEIINGETKNSGKDAHNNQAIVTKLKAVLTYGADKIPDMKRSIDFQNGSLVDKDVHYGFGPSQLKSWYDSDVSGKKKLDITV
jgi:hypothetical protein